jgi:DNA-binding NtrC family response regulator
MILSEVRILIVDDQRSARHILRQMFERLPAVKVDEACSAHEAQAKLAVGRFDLALIDIRLGPDPGNADGLDVIAASKQAGAIPVIVSGSSEMREVRAAMRLGAHDYIVKDELCEELVMPVVEKLCDQKRLEAEVVTLRARTSGDACALIVGVSEAINRLRSLVSKVAVSERPVLVRGPTGSGKELVVRAIHTLGGHPDAPLLDINCGAIPETLMESQLFGHEKGAFTGADRRHQGFFAAVGEGTLFLDEIAELPLTLQTKLLRVLEIGFFRPLGSSESHRFSGRVVAATHGNLEQMVQARTFREDLLFRLNVLEVRVPSLEERIDDIPVLAAHFARQQRRHLRFDDSAIDWLRAARWPGNVRQLRNLIDRVNVLSESEQISASILAANTQFPNEDVDAEESVRLLARAALRLPIPHRLRMVERAMIVEALAISDGNKSAAARLLGLHRKAVERRLTNDDLDETVAGDPDIVP